jgi:ABC-type multidrug transport system fused ATPase/permease subunit
MTLSGGERQRICLARAFLRTAKIVILDEPTSSVDVQTENMIVDAIERLTRSRTTFLITHRISALSGCDYVLNLETGTLTPHKNKPSRPLDFYPILAHAAEGTQ